MTSCARKCARALAMPARRPASASTRTTAAANAAPPQAPPARRCRHEDRARAELGGRDHRRALRHRLEQHQALCLGARGKHEDVRGRVAVEQLGVALEVAGEVHVALRPRAATCARSASRAGPSPAMTSIASGTLRVHAAEHVHQEADVLLVRHTADVGDEAAAAGAMPARARKAAPSPERKRSAASPVGSTWIGGAHAVRAQHRAHRFGRGDQGLHRGALRAREVARREAARAARGSTGT